MSLEPGDPHFLSAFWADSVCVSESNMPFKCHWVVELHRALLALNLVVTVLLKHVEPKTVTRLVGDSALLANMLALISPIPRLDGACLFANPVHRGQMSLQLMIHDEAPITLITLIRFLTISLVR